MNKENLQKISQVWRAGRLMVGMTQKELARELNISQASVSKFESMQLEPSASDWYLFCQLTGLDAHKTLELGYIDGRRKFKHLLFEKSLLRLPLHYRQDFSLKVREIIPFKVYVLKTLGENFWIEFLTQIKVSPEIFFIYDFQLSLNFIYDLLKACQKKGIELFHSESLRDFMISGHGVFADEYQKRKSGLDLVRSILENQNHYQRALEVIPSIEAHSFRLFPSERVQDFSEEFLEKFSVYKIEGLKASLDYFGFSSEIIEANKVKKQEYHIRVA